MLIAVSDAFRDHVQQIWAIYIRRACCDPGEFTIFPFASRYTVTKVSPKCINRVLAGSPSWRESKWLFFAKLPPQIIACCVRWKILGLKIFPPSWLDGKCAICRLFILFEKLRSREFWANFPSLRPSFCFCFYKMQATLVARKTRGAEQCCQLGGNFQLDFYAIFYLVFIPREHLLKTELTAQGQLRSRKVYVPDHLTSTNCIHEDAAQSVSSK